MKVLTGDWKTGDDIRLAYRSGKGSGLVFPSWRGKPEVVPYTHVAALIFADASTLPAIGKKLSYDQLISIFHIDGRSAVTAMTNKELAEVVRWSGLQPLSAGKDIGVFPQEPRIIPEEKPSKVTRYIIYGIIAVPTFFLFIIVLGLMVGKPAPKHENSGSFPSNTIATDAFPKTLKRGYEKYDADIRKGAELLIANKTCDSISLGDVSEKGSVKKPAFFYYCKKDGTDGTINLTLADIRSGNAAQKQPYPAAASMEGCEKFIKSQLQNPGTYKSGITQRSTRTFMNGRREVVIQFTARNGFNMESKFTGTCLIIPDGNGYDIEGSVVEG